MFYFPKEIINNNINNNKLNNNNPQYITNIE